VAWAVVVVVPNWPAHRPQLNTVVVVGGTVVVGGRVVAVVVVAAVVVAPVVVAPVVGGVHWVVDGL
jgi:hypothetical protein